MSARLLAGAAVLALLAACGEKPQDLKATKKSDAAAWQEVPGTHAEPGLKAGDRKAWEDHLRARTQRGQNEYSRAGNS